jgi:hypothetical protein
LKAYRIDYQAIEISFLALPDYDRESSIIHMTAKQFYDWQTSGGTDDVMRMVDCLERADIAWCAIGGVAVNHWAQEPMVTQDVDFVVAADAIERSVSVLEDAGFRSERFQWSINFHGRSKVLVQLSTEDFYREFPSRAVPADVHGILMRVASLEDTLRGKMKAYGEPERRQSKRIKDLADIARLVEAHPKLWDFLTDDLKRQIQPPGNE